MEFRFLGDSGLKVSAISYGNWVTHPEGKAEQATACVQAALKAGITTFDTAYVRERSGRDDSWRCNSGRAAREP